MKEIPCELLFESSLAWKIAMVLLIPVNVGVDMYGTV